MKIKTLTLNNFRAFPGSDSQKFTLDGKNLLVYGENGSGKSSIFHALKIFFTLKHPNYIGEARNIFSKDTDSWNSAEHWIEIEFNDGHKERWNGPPSAMAWTANPRVTEAARRRGFLDYRALLDTNYRHMGEEINLFEVAVKHLLVDYQLLGSPSTIGQLWANVLDTKPKTNRAEDVKPAKEACDKLNAVLDVAVETIQSTINALLPPLAAEGMHLDNLIFGRVGYDKDTRTFIGRLIPKISLYSKSIVYPHDFLNEARLSALGLATYLAGRLISVPTGGDELKLLVLDDVLIGIDLSNRLPLLDLLRKHFAEWQIVLLTHDRTWFDIAKDHVEDKDAWTSVKMYEGSREGPFSVPIVVEENGSVREVALYKATEFAKAGEYQAAANYARSAFEGALQRYCKKNSVPIAFEPDLKSLKTEDFLKAIEAWIMKDEKQVFFAAAFERSRLFRRIILNPLSHADVPAVKYEVNGAIAAVTKLEIALGQPLPQHAHLFRITRETATNPLPSDQQEAGFGLQIALANIRAKFAWSLRNFCERHRVDVPFAIERPSIIELWDCIHGKPATLFPENFAVLETQVNTEREWLIDEIDREKLESLTQAVLLRLIALLNPNSDEATALDVI